MKRFLSTTAVLLAMSGAAYAQSESQAFGDVQFQQGDFFASDLIGMRIYNSETEMETGAQVAADAEQEWDDIGEINDIIVSESGEVRGVILGVGGFLGMGEKDVSVSMDTIRVVQEEGDSNDRFLVVTTSKEALENAPTFERDLENDAEVNASATTQTDDVNTETAATMKKDGDDTDTAAATQTDETESNATAAVQTEDTDAEVKQTETAANAAETNDNMQQEALVRPTMQREGYAEADLAEVSQLKSDEIEGSYVYGANDETVGEIDGLIMDADGQVTEAVINVGGFLGLGEKPVAVAFDRIQVLKSEDGGEFRFYIDSTEEKLESMPEYEAN